MGLYPSQFFHERVAAAALHLGWQEEGFSPEIRPADPRFGDYQANGVLPFAKAGRRNPRQLAQSLLEQLLQDHLLIETSEISLAGPGFINFRIRPSFQLEWLRRHDRETRLEDSARPFFAGVKAVVDFGSPNTAKQMHVGHIRTILLGEAICRLLEFCGAEVVRDNHLGDWGTPYGKLFYGYRHFLDRDALKADPLEELERLYRRADEASREDPAVLDEVRRELVQLQSGHEANLALWETIQKLSIEALQEIYDLLGVRFDHFLGESFYRDKVDAVYEELVDAGIAVESEGALVVFHPEHPRFATQPFIIRKKDGASNYASTDLATMLYRSSHFGATLVLIVADSRQSDHFEQLELTCRKWFHATGRALPKFSHVSFGTILGEDGKAIKTRTGTPIRLKALLQEAMERAARLVEEKNPDLDPQEKEHIAKCVGVGAVRYTDLSQNRTSDYVFSWEKVLSMEGNTAPYLLYATARLHSLLRKAGEAVGEWDEEKALPPESPEEIQLARQLLGFGDALRLAVEDWRPHHLCNYLYELAGKFSTFYNSNKVLGSPEGILERRLLLCQRTLLFLQTGLRLLGLTPLERM